MENLNDIEKLVLEKLLTGEHSALTKLRSQITRCHVAHREWTGTGFITDFNIVEGSAPARVRSKLHFGDVLAEVDGIENGMGFMLNVRDGYLHSLEGYTFEESCPAELIVQSLGYTTTGPRDLAVFDSSFLVLPDRE